MQITPKILKEIGDRLRKLRQERNMSQTDVAEAMKVLPNQYNKVENGKVSPGLDTLVRIADALEVSIDVIVYGKNKYAEKAAAKARKEGMEAIGDDDILRRMKIINEMSPEDKFTALEMLDLVIAKNALKGLTGLINDFNSRKNPRFEH